MGLPVVPNYSLTTEGANAANGSGSVAAEQNANAKSAAADVEAKRKQQEADARKSQADKQQLLAEMENLTQEYNLMFDFESYVAGTYEFMLYQHDSVVTVINKN
ncbi:hypothetical protein CBER1_09627 [Cercospora berteroae]|uniref:Uncharacterized protein n=1 Tax=Cercospora berteroae TaxID=357750 RepID=A0A2S6BXC2_9PEZI|nr:hypothetical protein CBER1_09627 [Cercospora berteroae]